MFARTDNKVTETITIVNHRVILEQIKGNLIPEEVVYDLTN